jgi:uncharacterized repeat protein (TIGR03837 family)
MTQAALFSQSFSIDIFCRVIDNFGDAGVLWRLARDFTNHGHQVRLIIDDVKTLAALAPELKGDHFSQKTSRGIQVVLWESAWDMADCPLEPAQIVIEGFACQIPRDYEYKMSQMENPPVWINLDYMSAENWIDEFNALPSPHPTLPLTKYFWFPGVSKKSAGLIIEDGYRPRQDRFDHVAFLEKMGADPELVTLFFFAYPYGPIAKLARALASYKRPLQILLSATKSGEMLKAELEKLEASHIRLVQLPFVDQESFDEILWASDIAFIRGEDSAARAMLAGTPFVWHIYHQDDDAHMVKLAAMSEKMREVAGDTPLFNTWEQFQAGYNEGDIDGEALHQLLEHLEQWLLWSHWWQNHLHENGPMSQKFAEFLRNR